MLGYKRRTDESGPNKAKLVEDEKIVETQMGAINVFSFKYDVYVKNMT